MVHFTSSYLAAVRQHAGPTEPDATLPAIRAGMMPIRELYVSATALASMHTWNLPSDDEARRRATTRACFDSAADDLLDAN